MTLAAVDEVNNFTDCNYQSPLLSNDGNYVWLEDKRDDYQKSLVLYCVSQ